MKWDGMAIVKTNVFFLCVFCFTYEHSCTRNLDVHKSCQLSVSSAIEYFSGHFVLVLLSSYVSGERTGMQKYVTCV